MEVPDDFALNIIHEENAHLEEDFDNRCAGLEEGLERLFGEYPFAIAALGLPWTRALYCQFVDDALTILHGRDMVRLTTGDRCNMDRWIHLRYTGDENGGEWVPSRVVVKTVHLSVGPEGECPVVEADVSMTDDLVVGSAIIATLSSPSGVAQTPREVQWLPEGYDLLLSKWVVAPSEEGDDLIQF